MDHLGFRLSKITMCLTVNEKKQDNMQRMAGKLLPQATYGKGMVSAECLCGSAVPLIIEVTLERFYTRSGTVPLRRFIVCPKIAGRKEGACAL